MSSIQKSNNFPDEIKYQRINFKENDSKDLTRQNSDKEFKIKSYRPLTDDEFTKVEVKFKTWKHLDFWSRTVEIQTPEDVAFIFRNLESEAVEHIFAVHHKKDNSVQIQHLGTGTYNATIADTSAILAGIEEFDTASVTIVHNHPSGNLTSSAADKKLLGKIESILPENVKLNPGIILNLTSGKYLEFDENIDLIHGKAEGNNTLKLRAKTFSKKVFNKDLFDLPLILSTRTAAELSSKLRFGTAEKIYSLLTDNSNRAVAALVPNVKDKNWTETLKSMAVKTGANGVIFATNQMNYAKSNDFFNELKTLTPVLNVLDVIHVEPSEFIRNQSYYSAAAEGILPAFEPKTEIGSSHVNEFSNKENSGKLVREENSLEKQLSSFQKQKEYLIDSGLGGQFTVKYKGYDSTKEKYNFQIVNPGFERTLTFDKNTLHKIKEINPKNHSKMTTKEDVQNANQQVANSHDKEREPANKQMNYLAKQMMYLGFALSNDQKTTLEDKIKSNDKSFSMDFTSDKTNFGNKMDYKINFNRGDKGGVFLNNYETTLTKKNGDVLTHKFAVNQQNNITAKEALNLMEGRAVKTQLANKENGELSPAFIKLNFNEKTDYGNFKIEVYNENYGVNTAKIVDKSPLKFEKEEYRENTIKALEKGNIVKAKMEIDSKESKGFAVLNPQYKMINLYDQNMRRINTNKPDLSIDNSQAQDKARIKQHSISRGV